MTTKVTTESFIEKAKAVHGAKYDYSQVIYIGAKTKIKIGCSEHGFFEQQPTNHLSSHGCPKCVYESQALVISSQAKEFKDKANNVHNNKYDYSLVEYKNAHVKVSIGCPIHGSFSQTPNSHLGGQGCPHCALSEQGWTRTKFKDKCDKNNNGLGILYIIGCWSDDKSEVFIKIGITSRSIKARYPSKTKMPYNYKIIHEITGDPEYIYDLETKLHKKSKNHKYIPTISFAGSSTECFIADKTYLNNLNSYISSLIPF